ncbi:PolC-type DNA polymerase III [Clostridium sp. MSJ-11]|uniref:DNA polymerase III PolC-type n=1 Tax=Clostridium mobile TaxID=2841512 RepID=A0ABS6EC58_9CLOT|nr:PolC-type DNA polymerase III [Clostridium mobile]MBU5482781.1 PolC-type DNA polymerase III [Clostridium mobile]
MNIDLAKILHDENPSSQDLLKDIKILKIQYLKKSNKLKVILKSFNEFNKDMETRFKEMLYKKFNFFNDIELVFYKDISNVTLKDLCNNYWCELTNAVVTHVPLAKECMLNGDKSVEDNILTIRYGNEFIYNMLRNKNFEELTYNIIRDIFGLECKVKLAYEVSCSNQECNELEEEEMSLIKEIIKNSTPKLQKNKVISLDRQKNDDKNSKGDKDSSILLGKNINEDWITIDCIDEPMGMVTICGDIFKRTVIETKTGRKIVSIYVTDYTGSITVKIFTRPKDEEKVLEEIKEGLYCKIRGEAIYDNYAREVVIMARDIIKLNKIMKMDNAEEKRVELHLHTRMSAMDAMTSAANLVERAAKWGHSAIAITDHGVVQAYPEAMDAGKKHKIKILYGVEAYLVDDGVPIVIGGEGRTIDDEFVVFDIETTGFSSINDKIIEIGAVKIKNGRIIDSFSSFVNPKVTIPLKIVELTSITDEMVKDAEEISEVLPRFLEFVGDTVVVAHNASFDVSFIKKNCKDLGLTFNNPIMDTIPLAKFLYPELKRYKLNIVAKHLGISLENHHRAVDDAKATGEILVKSFETLSEREIFTLENINEEYFKNIDVKTLPTYHLIILAQNMTGLKNLYKLISHSHLDHFYKRPRMPKSLIQKYKDGLIIGSACEAGEIYKEILKGKSYDELKNTVDFYDYLEIQPLENNYFMIRNGTVKDVEELKNINKKICELGERYNKPVVATCDVHFLNPEDEIYRRIIMNGQGYSDADNQPPLYFRTTEEMLKEFNYLGTEKSFEVVVKNTNKIADLIEEIKPIPDETFPPKIEGAEEEIRQMTLNKTHGIYGDDLPEVVQKRLDKELNSIINNGYAVLYLIAHKLVDKSYQDGYLVGSRGSVGSSFVATMSDITEVNGLPPHYVCSNCKYSEFITDGSISSGADLPDKDCPECGNILTKDGHDIPFETFLGFEGDKEPDIDLNFSGEYQSVVHKYTEELFGKGHVFRAGTIGTIAEKTAYGFVRKYLTEKNIHSSGAEIERLTLGCTGIKRTTGQHPGGVMVVPQDNEIFNFSPIQRPADDNNTEIITTHFDYHSISGRLLKLDILGHDDPTVLRMLQDLTGLDPKTIPLADPKVMSLFTSTEALGISKEELGCEVATYGLPEFGTKFVRQMLIDTQPKTFSDLVRISGLSHGTDVWLNNAQYYIKEGYTTLKDCIATRDDIMVYLIYKGLPPKTAFNIMEKVRKGKGLSEEQEQVMKENGVPEWYIESCKKIKYMFPKGHAVAYVMMAVRIAYFKVYYPKEYYATYFSVRADDFDADIILKGIDSMLRKMEEINAMGNNATPKDKGLLTTLEICHEMYLRGIKFLEADLYKSHAEKFIIEDDGIRIPLSALTGVGVNAAKNIVEGIKLGEFISKEDLKIRGKATRTVIEALDNHGCLKGMPETNQLSLFNL